MTSPIKAWREQKKISSFLGLKGKIVSWTRIRVAPQGFLDQAPYIVAVAELENNKRLVGQVVDVWKKEIKIGDRVEVVYRRQKKPDQEGVIYYGIKFRLL